MSCPDALHVHPPVRGRFHRWRRRLQAASALLFLTAPFLGLARLDLAGDRLVLAGASFHRGELAPVYLLLLLGMLAIFAGALLYGRLWCGWLCPQTALSELASALDRAVLRSPAASKVRRALAALLLLGLAAVMALALASYVASPRELAEAPSWAWLAIAVLTALLGADLLWLRHDFCVSACPYGILQALVRDERTAGVHFGQDLSDVCVHCHACISSCFIGLDVRRQPFDSRCLNCGACIDAIRDSHDRRGLPFTGGFAYGTAPSSWPAPLAAVGVRDARRAAVAGALVLVAAVLVGSLAGRRSLEARLSPAFERTRIVSGGAVTNAYTVTVTNRQPGGVSVRVLASGLADLQVVEPAAEVRVDPGKPAAIPVLVRARGDALTGGAHPFRVHLIGEHGDLVEPLAARFFVPDRRPL